MTHSMKLDWHGGPDDGWWVALLKDGERVAFMSLDEWKALGATRQAIEDDAIDRLLLQRGPPLTCVLLRRGPFSESGASGDSAMTWTRRSCPLIDNGHYRRCRTPGCKARMAASAGDGLGRLIRSNGSSQRALRQAHPFAEVARRYGLNSNMLLTWRRRERADVNDVGKTVNIVPVRVVEATPTATATSMGRMEIVLVGGERILVGADVDATALARIVKALEQR